MAESDRVGPADSRRSDRNLEIMAGRAATHRQTWRSPMLPPQGEGDIENSAPRILRCQSGRLCRSRVLVSSVHQYIRVHQNGDFQDQGLSFKDEHNSTVGDVWSAAVKQTPHLSQHSTMYRVKEHLRVVRLNNCIQLDRWKVYIANRVSDTVSRIASHWRHVHTDSNPADVASRGTTPKELLQHPIWWTGPE